MVCPLVWEAYFPFLLFSTNNQPDESSRNPETGDEGISPTGADVGNGAPSGPGAISPIFLYLLLDESLGNLEARDEKISVKIADFGSGTPFGLGRCFPFLYLVCSYVG